MRGPGRPRPPSRSRHAPWTSPTDEPAREPIDAPDNAPRPGPPAPLPALRGRPDVPRIHDDEPGVPPLRAPIRARARLLPRLDLRQLYRDGGDRRGHVPDPHARQRPAGHVADRPVDRVLHPVSPLLLPVRPE